MYVTTGPLAQSAERGADNTLLLRRGREFEPLTDQKNFFLIPFCRISIYFLCLLYRLDCKTVGFFLEVSNSASFETFCLTARAYLNPGLAYAKIRTVLQSTLWPTGRRNRICSYKFIDVFFLVTNNIDFVFLTSLLASGVAPLTKKPEDSCTISVPPQWNQCDMSHF